MESLCEFSLRVVWSVLGVFFLTFALKLVNALWLRPMRQERCLKKQGINGVPYNLLKRQQAPSVPNTLSHDILDRVDAQTNETNKKYGTMFYLWRGHLPRIILLEPKLIREMLTNKSGEFYKPEINAFTRLFVAGVSSLNGEKWVMRRKLLSPAFHIDKLKGMLPSIVMCAERMITKWDGILGFQESCELDVCSEFQKLTADIISHVAFGSSFEEGSEVFQLLNEQGKLFNSVYYIAAFPWLRHLPTRTNARMKYIHKEVANKLRVIIQNREEIMKNGNNVNDDLLGMMLESNQNEQRESKNSHNSAMTLNEIIDECKLFYFAGHETTATLLTWTIVALSMHPDWQEKAREEVLGLIGLEDTPTFDDLSRLKTVTMVLQETLRLYPPSSIIRTIGRKGAKLGDIYIPGGAHVFIPMTFVHRDEHVWGGTVLDYNPGRFSEGISKASDKDSAPFFPFGWGPRVCIGQNLAMLEAKMALSMVLRRYTFELSPSYTHCPFFLLTLQPLYGVPVIIRKLELED